MTASLLYCLYPAPSVLAVPYTEPFYALFTFTGMLAIARSQVLLATVTFVLAAAFRSNGLLNAGFLLWHLFWVKPSPSMILVSSGSRLASRCADLSEDSRKGPGSCELDRGHRPAFCYAADLCLPSALSDRQSSSVV